MNDARTEAADRIADFAREGRLVQNAWHDERDGRELACLLGAIGPEVRSPEDCPASAMPAWLAHLLPRLFDGVRETEAADFGSRFAAALRAKPVDDAVRDRWLARVVAYARAAAADAAVWAVAEEAAEEAADAAYAAYAVTYAAANAKAYAAARAAARAARTKAYETMFNWLLEEMET